jgi:hypothetical protein
VNDFSDEAREEEAPLEEAGEGGWSRVKKEDVKGKQKDMAEDHQESGMKEIGNTEAMDVDSEEVDQLAEGSSPPSRTSQPKATTWKSSMKPGKESVPTPNVGNTDV